MHAQGRARCGGSRTFALSSEPPNGCRISGASGFPAKSAALSMRAATAHRNRACHVSAAAAVSSTGVASRLPGGGPAVAAPAAPRPAWIVAGSEEVALGPYASLKSFTCTEAKCSACTVLVCSMPGLHAQLQLAAWRHGDLMLR